MRLFYGQPSTYLWEDDYNIVHSIPQGEGGEQGDPLMPLLLSFGQHRHCKQWRPSCKMVRSCSRSWTTYMLFARRELWNHARIRVHNGKTHVWNMSGVRPVGCDMLQRLAEQHDPEARVRTGSECRQQSKESSSWALRWVTTNSCGHNWS